LNCGQNAQQVEVSVRCHYKVYVISSNVVTYCDTIEATTEIHCDLRCYFMILEWISLPVNQVLRDRERCVRGVGDVPYSVVVRSIEKIKRH